MPLISDLQRQRWTGLGFQGQSGLQRQSEFQDFQGYTEKYSLQNKKTNKRNTYTKYCILMPTEKNVKSVLLSNKQVTPATEIEKRHKGIQSKNRIRLYLELYLALKIC